MTIPKILKTPFLISFLIGSLAVLLSLVFYFRVQPQIPIFYSLSDSEQQLAPKEWLFFFPVFSLLVSFLHLALLLLIKKYDGIILKFFAWSTAIVQVVLLLVMLRILWMIA